MQIIDVNSKTGIANNVLEYLDNKHISATTFLRQGDDVKGQLIIVVSYEQKEGIGEVSL